MKVLIVIAAVIMTLMVSGIPMAEAAFFDVSNGWWMAESQWTKSTTGGNNIMQNGDKLEVTGTGVTGYAKYRSNWTLGMNEDFAFSTGYFYNPASVNSIMKLGLIPTGATNINGVSIGRGDEWDTSSGADRARLYWEVDLGSGLTQDFEWSSGGGIFVISYDSDDSQHNRAITLSVPGTVMSETYILPSTIGPMSVYLGGGSRSDTGVPIPTPGRPEAESIYFSNFQFINGAPGNPGVVPEPATMSLLGLGLLGLAGFGKKRKA